MDPIDIFIAYSVQDKDLMERFRKQLSVAERIGLVDTWHDGDIEIGTDKEQAAVAAMEKAEIVVLLLSADFFASEHLYEKEMKPALELSKSGKAVVIPVLLKECTWQLTPISNLQILPQNNIPVTNVFWKDPDNAFKQVVDEIIYISNQIRKANGGKTTIYTPTKSTHQETDDEKSTLKNSPKEETSLLKIALIAIAGLGTLALLSFIVDQFFTHPVPKKPAEQEEKIYPEDTSKTIGSNTDKSGMDPSSTYFPVLKIGKLEWTKKNQAIPLDPSWCYLDNPENCDKSGRLYNFEGALKACPEGWRLPTKEEWLSLSDEEISQLELTKGGVYDRGSFRQMNEVGYYFSSVRSSGGEIWVIEFRGNDKAIQSNGRYSHWGMSCRCVK